MPRKSHRRRRRDRRGPPPEQSWTSRTQAEEEQDQLRQEALRVHVEKALAGRRTPPINRIIEEQRKKWRKGYDAGNSKND